MRGLRILAPARLTNYRQEAENRRLRNAAYFFAMMGVIMEFAISGNTLADLGVDYSAAGGNLLVKLHPGTYLISIGALITLFMARPAGSAVIRLFRETPSLAMYNILIVFCAIYSIVNVGFSGAAVYIESFLSAGILAVALENATDRQKRALAWVIIFFCLVSIVMSIYEGATQTHLIPMNFGDDETSKQAEVADAENFRGAGLFAHPLVAAVVTAMALFMLLRMEMNGLLKAGLFTFMLIGLLSFGGRASLGTAVGLVGIATVFAVLRGIVRRDLSLGLITAVGAGVLILPPLILLLISGTDIGGRIISHLYFDDSAQVRNAQWDVMNYLNLHDVLFGVTPQRMGLLKYQIGLGSDTTDIENFWLLMFLNLGTMGFIVFVIALCMLVNYLGRKVSHPLGWLLLLAAIMIDSTSNSLGRKSIDLFVMTACMIAMTGYGTSSRTQPVTSRRRSVTSLRRHPSHDINLAGIKP